MLHNRFIIKIIIMQNGHLLCKTTISTGYCAKSTFSALLLELVLLLKSYFIRCNKVFFVVLGIVPILLCRMALLLDANQSQTKASNIQDFVLFYHQ